MHASPCWTVVVGLDAPLELEGGGRAHRGRAVLVAPHTAHILRCEGLSVSYQAEPGAANIPFHRAVPEIRWLEGRSLDRVTALSRAQTLDASSDRDRLSEIFAGMEWTGAKPADRRVRSALEALSQNPDLHFDTIASKVQISPVRLRHLVRDATGASLRVLRLWRRTLHAVELHLRGHNFTDAASISGFADQAHFTRAFKRFLGRSPSSMRGRGVLLEMVQGVDLARAGDRAGAVRCGD